MKFIILAALYIAVIIIKHLQWKVLLTDDSGAILSYINLVFFYPLASAFLIAAVVCVIVRKTQAYQMIIGINWVMGMILSISAAILLSDGFSWNYTAPGTPVTLTFPDKQWKPVTTAPYGYRLTLVMKDTHAGLSVVSDTQDASNIHNFNELLTWQQIKYKQDYQADRFNIYPCSVDGFRCGYQDFNQIAEDGTKKRTLLMSLFDKTHFVQIIAVIDLPYVGQYYDSVKEIMFTVRPVK
ncbi:hypothetical protein [Superficieibacter sp. 1612_C1]|uniref:hypothetical protein n=1 Tax=Superficieibacter sp. 1612_C1 TaxID=2780382 RepID=UPI00188314CA|nr:hypothetical protein [Superficieibacter sp. 1612_C1]